MNDGQLPPLRSGSDAKTTRILKARKKVAVHTGQGTLYVKYLALGDISKIAKIFKQDAPDLAAVGRAVLLKLTSMTSASEDNNEIDEALFKALTEQDLRSLASTIATESHLSPLADGDPLVELGRAFHETIKRATKEVSKTLSEVKSTWDSQWATIGESTRAALQDSLLGINDISKRLRESSAVETFIKTVREAKSTSAVEEYVHTNKQFIDAAKVSEVEDSFITADGKRGSAFNHYRPPPIELPELETLPIGRAANATEETARQITEVAGLMGAMVAGVGDLSTTLVGKVVPEWMKKLDEDRESARKTLDQAKNSLRWTKWAVIASVFLTVWQVWLAQEYKLDNDKQQTAIEDLLREQLGVMQQFRKQAAEEADKTRKLVEALSSSTENKKFPTAQPNTSRSKSDGK